MTDATRQKALRDRKIAQGLRQVLVWVPRHRAEETRQIAERMRGEEREKLKRTHNPDMISRAEADRIEELEAALAKAVEALHQIAGDKDFADDPWGIARTTLAELTGEKT